MLTAVYLINRAGDLAQDRWDAAHRAVAFRPIDDQLELELSNGTVYRTDKHGEIVWWHFPSGERAGDLERHLQRELERLRLVEKWTQ
jgi:hypothetical protein